MKKLLKEGTMTDQIGENEKKFLLELFKQSSGSTSAKISMYDVGAAVGLDKPEAKRMAEEMMAWNLIEVRTLSGGIAMTDNGLEKAREMGAAVAGSDAGVRLGNTPVLNDTVRQAVDNLVAALKIGIAKSGSDFDMLNELIADIRTVEAQLCSSKPKTAKFIRECFHSIKGVLKTKEYSDQIRTLLGE
ncbi:MAG: hypothetical protein HC887_07950 [Desulfobacteraceae bacterium]|nr:hypothetical protein [Desulfobacteraceae bacterium]